MRHRKKGRKLGRGSAHRKATINNLLKSLLKYELVQTTDAKAKELRRHADKLVTLAKKDTVHARQQAHGRLGDRDLVGKLFDDLAKREEIAEREGGYVRLIKLGNRQGDNAPVTRISWVGSNLENTEELRFPAHIRELIETEEVVEGEDEDLVEDEE